MVAAVAPENLKEWHTPSTRPDVIHELIHGVDRYNPSNLPFMEDYLASELKEGQYDLFANLAILKLYQFNPQHSNPDVIINILIKALSATVSGPDFNLCLEMLREPSAILHDIESADEALVIVMPYLQKLHELSRTCQFTKFWQEINSDSEAAKILRTRYLSQHASPLDDFRFIFSASIASCFRRISLSQLSRWLDLSSDKVAEWCSQIEWRVEGQDAVIPNNGQNDVKAGVVKENVQLGQLTKLVAAAGY
ncbi:eukaryotic translation initiation factor 3 subunit K [Cryptococcus bacillisporus CA1280]|uniref:Eukaryotic translation initiation factor 3 subunit K n=2 Tax=Cryptococcus gattii TaxID=552467 RepID=A0A0D0VS75_CRYGA|nr:eukaryotic translation initiation factor 3 subunit K [Cryptococcus bacillisporus CA1280]KIR68481.1 eukaryotic translation initiation factor 3 subunit K [Cryptococcus bacillisporus CA1873]|eukprot:KIR68481.1 eukaryotic translation initiation factor 3 subunit K [Cryptococcus gattii CA1873]